MIKMSVWEKIQGVINERKQKKIKQSVEEMESIYKDTETKEEGISEITGKVVERINSNPELTWKYLELIQKSEILPTEIVVKVIK